MIEISKQYTFDSAHQLDLEECTINENLAMFGKCNNLHGHTYILTVGVTGKVDSKTGMVLNYFELDNIVKPIVDGKLDHKFLNQVFPDMLTTAENMVLRIGEIIALALPQGVQLSSITLQETPKTTARWVPQ